MCDEDPYQEVVRENMRPIEAAQQEREEACE